MSTPDNIRGVYTTTVYLGCEDFDWWWGQIIQPPLPGEKSPWWADHQGLGCCTSCHEDSDQHGYTLPGRHVLSKSVKLLLYAEVCCRVANRMDEFPLSKETLLCLGYWRKVGHLSERAKNREKPYYYFIEQVEA